MKNETLTYVFWGLFLIWIGFVALLLKGDLGATINEPIFGFGTGLLLLGMNLMRSMFRIRVSIVTLGLGTLLAIIYAPIVFFNVPIPFIPALLIIAGVALVIGALRSRSFL